MKVGEQEGRPLGNRVLVKADERREKKTAGGIIMPEQAQERPNQGIVVSVGPRSENVAEGDRVLYGKYAGSEVAVGGEPFLIMAEDDILMTLRGAAVAVPS